MGGNKCFYFTLILLVIGLCLTVEAKKKSNSSQKKKWTKSPKNPTTTTESTRTTFNPDIDEDDYNSEENNSPRIDDENMQNKIGPNATLKMISPINPVHGGEDIISSKLLDVNVCGKKFFCRRGVQGPCLPNEILLERNLPSDMTPLACDRLDQFPWQGCYSSGQVGHFIANAKKGTCVLRSPGEPCSGYAPNYRYYLNKKRCFPITNAWYGAIANPCEENAIFVDVDGIYGTCVCKDKRHMVWRPNEKCYLLYSKGPCGINEWLEPDDNSAVCRTSPCPGNADGNHIYWNETSSKAGCYRSNTQGPCDMGSMFIIDDFITRRTRCVSQPYSDPYNPSGQWNGQPNYQPGQWNNPSGYQPGSSNYQQGPWNNPSNSQPGPSYSPSNYQPRPPSNYQQGPWNNPPNYQPGMWNNPPNYQSGPGSSPSNYQPSPWNNSPNYQARPLNSPVNYPSVPMNNPPSYQARPLNSPVNYPSLPMNNPPSYQARPLNSPVNYPSVPMNNPPNYQARPLNSPVNYPSVPMNNPSLLQSGPRGNTFDPLSQPASRTNPSSYPSSYQSPTRNYNPYYSLTNPNSRMRGSNITPYTRNHPNQRRINPAISMAFRNPLTSYRNRNAFALPVHKHHRRNPISHLLRSSSMANQFLIDRLLDEDDQEDDGFSLDNDLV